MCGPLSAQLLHVSAYKYTWAPTGDREVATVGKDKKDGFTVMVAHDVAGNMMPPFINTKCTSSQSMHKFLIPPGASLDDMKEYWWDVQHGIQRGNGIARHLCKPEKVDKKTKRVTEEAVTAKYPPFYEGINGEIISIGNDNHRMKLFNLKL